MELPQSNKPSIVTFNLAIEVIQSARRLPAGAQDARKAQYCRPYQGDAARHHRWAAFAGSTTERASVSSDGKQANGNSQRPSISRDGHFVAFDSDATKLVAVSNHGRQANSVNDPASSSADGHVVV